MQLANVLSADLPLPEGHVVSNRHKFGVVRCSMRYGGGPLAAEPRLLQNGSHRHKSPSQSPSQKWVFVHTWALGARHNVLVGLREDTL